MRNESRNNEYVSNFIFSSKIKINMRVRDEYNFMKKK